MWERKVGGGVDLVCVWSRCRRRGGAWHKVLKVKELQAAEQTDKSKAVKVKEVITKVPCAMSQRCEPPG